LKPRPNAWAARHTSAAILFPSRCLLISSASACTTKNVVKQHCDQTRKRVRHREPSRTPEIQLTFGVVNTSHHLICTALDIKNWARLETSENGREARLKTSEIGRDSPAHSPGHEGPSPCEPRSRRRRPRLFVLSNGLEPKKPNSGKRKSNLALHVTFSVQDAALHHAPETPPPSNQAVNQQFSKPTARSRADVTRGPKAHG
jgi:hypothetical protein